MSKLKATLETARMTDEQLLKYGFTREEIEAGDHLLGVSGAVGNSSALLADMASAIALAPYSVTAIAAAQAAAGPITDIKAVLASVLLNFQEAREKLCYILEGKQISTSLTAPTGGLITTGADSATFNLLVGIYQLLQ